MGGTGTAERSDRATNLLGRLSRLYRPSASPKGITVSKRVNRSAGVGRAACMEGLVDWFKAAMRIEDAN